MKMVQFCCGGNVIPGWENHDADIDIAQSLPYVSESVDRIFIEHGIEHIAPFEVWSFLKECYRILRPGGILRVAFPDITKVCNGIITKADFADKYIAVAGPHPVESLVCGHGHKSIFNVALMKSLLQATGYSVCVCNVGESVLSELRNLEGHGKVVGEDVNRFETAVCEATKKM